MYIIICDFVNSVIGYFSVKCSVLSVPNLVHQDTHHKLVWHQTDEVRQHYCHSMTKHRLSVISQCLYTEQKNSMNVARDGRAEELHECGQEMEVGGNALLSLDPFRNTSNIQLNYCNATLCIHAQTINKLHHP